MEAKKETISARSLPRATPNGVLQLKLHRKLLEQELVSLDQQIKEKKEKNKRRRKRKEGKDHDGSPLSDTGEEMPEIVPNNDDVTVKRQQAPFLSISSSSSTSLLPQPKVLGGPVTEQLRQRKAKTKASVIIKSQLKQRNLNPIQKTEEVRPVIPPSEFPTAYARGEVPCILVSTAGGTSLQWTKPPQDLDLERMFPLFFDGLREKQYPYDLLAKEGVKKLLAFAKVKPKKIVKCIPRLIAPIRIALSTLDYDIILFTLECIQSVLQVHKKVAHAFKDYFHLILQPMSKLREVQHQIPPSADSVMRGVRKDLAESLLETLEMMETLGGEGAFDIIKFIIPTYESCLKRQRERVGDNAGEKEQGDGAARGGKGESGAPDSPVKFSWEERRDPQPRPPPKPLRRPVKAASPSRGGGGDSAFLHSGDVHPVPSLSSMLASMDLPHNSKG